MNPINDLITGVDSNKYNTGDPSEQAGDIAYLQKLKAMRQARDSGTATASQIASAYRSTTGRDINAPALSNLPYQQLRTAREMQDAGAGAGIVGAASGGVAAKPAVTTPSMVAKSAPWNPYNPKPESKLSERGAQYDFSNMQPGDMRFIDPRTKGFVNTNDVTFAANERAGEANQAYLDKVNSSRSPYSVPEKQDINAIKAQGDVMAKRYNDWRAKIDASPRATVSQPAMPNTRRERQDELARAAQATGAEANRKFQGEQGQREADTAKFVATEKARGEIGKTEREAQGAQDLEKLRGKNAQDTATIKNEVGEAGAEAKAIIAGLQSEDENVRKAAAAQFMKRFGGEQAAEADAPVAKDATGKPVYKRNGKFVYADGAEYKKA